MASRRLRRRHGRRRREGQGLRVPGPQRLPDPERRDAAFAHRGRDVLDGGARLRQEVRRRPGRDQGGAGPHRVEEPLQRRPQPAGPVPQGDERRADLRHAGGRREAVGVRLRRRGRRLRRGHRGPGRGRPPVHRHAALHQGAVVRGRQRLRASPIPTTTTRTSPRSWRAPTRTPRPASPTRATSWRWPRCTTASRRPSSCSWRTSASPSGARRGRRSSPARSTSTATCR